MVMDNAGDQNEPFRNSESFHAAMAAVPSSMTYVAISTAMLGAIMFGIDCANFGSVIGFEKFIDEWCVGGGFGTYDECHASEKPASWDNVFVNLGNTLLTVGAALGAILLAPTLSERCGRRACISVGSFVVVAGCILSDLSNGSVIVFMFSRFLTGFGIGVCCYALPMYNAEIATPEIRGRMGALFQWLTVAGSWFVAILVQFFDNWYVGMLLPGAAGLIVGVLIWTVPESPRWTLKYGTREATAEILKKLRVGDIEPELKSIEEAMDAEKNQAEITYGDLMSGTLKIRVFVAIGMQICQQLTGVNAILGQSNTFFTKFGIPNPYLFNNVWTGLQLLSVTIGVLLIDASFGGRRSQLLWATYLMAPPLFLSCIFLWLEAPWIWGALMLIIYGMGFQLAWGLVPWVYPSEIFKMNERSKAMGVSVFFQYGVNSVVYFTSPLMIHWSIIGTCLIFGVINAFNLFFVTRYVKETKGVPLENVPDLFK